MEQFAKIWNRLLWVMIFIVGTYIIVCGGQRVLRKVLPEAMESGAGLAQGTLLESELHFLYPGFFAEDARKTEASSFSDWLLEQLLALHPLKRLEYAARSYQGMESEVTYEMMTIGGLHDENETDENGEDYDMAALAVQENERALESGRTAETEDITETTLLDEEVLSPGMAGAVYNMEELADFDFLFSHFYTMENNTTISASELNAETLLSKDMRIDKSMDGPQILIYHTHSQEGFADSVPGDNSTTIVGVGARLAELLEEKGYGVLHVTSVYDLVNGELDRNEAYSKAEKEISAILAEYPSIQSVIDLHRDGVREGTRLVTEVDGKSCAQFMFFNGLSRSKKNGPIDYLYNPYIQDNLALTLQLKLACEQFYPGLSRNIYLKSLRYNLHLSPKALLIEAGAQTNTLEEMLNTMEPLADILDRVFGG